MGGRAVAGTSSRKSTARPDSGDGLVVLTAPIGERIGRELASLAMLVAAAFATLSLIAADFLHPPNLCGPLGQALSDYLAGYFGYGGFLLLVLTAAAALALWSESGWPTMARIAAAGLILVSSAAALAALLGGAAAGGYLGDVSAQLLLFSMGFIGSYLVVGLGLICGLALLFRRSPTELINALSAGAAGAMRRAAGQPEPDRDSEAFELGPDSLVEPSREPLTLTIRAAQDAREGRRLGPLSILARAISERAAAPRPLEAGAYQLPPLALLDTPPLEHAKIDEEALKRSASLLEQKLGDFGVEGKVVEVQPGPVVTMYKFEPASGVKVSQIVNLADDLSMALKALAIRIQAPVPGEAVVGIEVPNRKREKVYLREILESGEFAAAQSQLTIALGKDISGQPVVADLARMPHLLIAGATGTGKSVSIHTMIASVLFNATADDVRFILIDPKMLELSVYDNLPHLLVPVIVEPDKAAAALLWATQEMENRYRLMRDMGVRNIDGYNRAIEAGQQALGP
ncbi:MAG TPA: DNA translocase FtsK 4TM domain-containing protein, partial [Candidatus Binataceae bacterium]|nr:DNA translocase FtsK 4TM domain-containing protein [Candidatus Binataceae bacterium]